MPPHVSRLLKKSRFEILVKTFIRRTLFAMRDDSLYYSITHYIEVSEFTRPSPSVKVGFLDYKNNNIFESEGNDFQVKYFIPHKYVFKSDSKSSTEQLS